MSTPYLPLIPNLQPTKWTTPNGDLHPQQHGYMSNLNTVLQQTISNEGIKVPQLDTANINKLTDADKSTGNFIYDNTTHEMKVNINGVWRVVALV